MFASFLPSRLLQTIVVLTCVLHSLPLLGVQAELVSVEYSGAVSSFSGNSVLPAGTLGTGAFTFDANVADENPAAAQGFFSNILLSGFTSIGGEVIEFDTSTATANIFNSVGPNQDLVAIGIPIAPTSFAGFEVTSLSFNIQDEFSVQPGGSLNSDDLDLATFQSIAGTSAWIEFRSDSAESIVLTIDALSVSAVPEPTAFPLVMIFAANLLRRKRSAT